MNAVAQTSKNSGERMYTIGTVSKLTGVGAITLRAWERRYGLIEPVRKESGHRLYTRRHIDQINRITSLTQQGIRISQIRPEMLESEVAPDEGPEADQWRRYMDSMLAAIINFDEDRVEEVYNEALAVHPIGIVTRKLLTPLLIELGIRWETGEPASIAEEHFFAFYLRNKLGARFHHRPRRNTGPLLLLAGLPGEHHDIGLLLFALAAIEGGYRILPLGADMPLEHLAPLARSRNCDAIVLSGATEPGIEVLNTGLPELVTATRLPVVVGGVSSVYGCDAITKAGAEPLGQDIDHGLQKLRELLDR
jgi:DNA-binding transcriptional MerR regulator